MSSLQTKMHTTNNTISELTKSCWEFKTTAFKINSLYRKTLPISISSKPREDKLKLFLHNLEKSETLLSTLENLFEDISNSECLNERNKERFKFRVEHCKEQVKVLDYSYKHIILRNIDTSGGEMSLCDSKNTKLEESTNEITDIKQTFSIWSFFKRKTQ